MSVSIRSIGRRGNQKAPSRLDQLDLVTPGQAAMVQAGTGTVVPKVSVVIPTLNEARNLPHVFSRLPTGLHEVIVVDGHSVDDTLAAARRLRPEVRIIAQNRRGKGNALACGFAAATGDIIVMIDADGSADPAEIPRFVSVLLDGADYAKGSRFADGGGSSDITRLRGAGNRVLNVLVNLLCRTQYSDLCYGYNALWRRHVPVLGLDAESAAPADGTRLWGDGFEVETLMNIRVAQAKLDVREVASYEYPRIHGVSNLNALSDGYRVLRTILYERYLSRHRKTPVTDVPDVDGDDAGLEADIPEDYRPAMLSRARVGKGTGHACRGGADLDTFVRLTSDEPRTRPNQAAKTRHVPLTVHLIRPGELRPAEIATWHSMQDATPPLADPFLSPEFARAVGRVQPDTHVAVLAGREATTGFFPFERRRLGVGVPVGGWLSLSQGLIHAAGTSWDARKLLSGCGLAAWEFDSLITDQQPFQPYHAGQVPVPMIDLSQGAGAYRAQLEARSPRFCRELDRKIRKLGRDVGEVRIVPDSRDPGMLRMLMSWKSGQYRRTGHVDTFEPPWVADLLHDLHQTRSHHMTGMLSVVYAGDQPAAAQFGLRAGSLFHGWFTAYDPRFSSYSPGLILIKKMAEGFAAAGIDTIYMGRGSSSYKDAMKSRDVFVAEGVATSRSVLGVAHRTRTSASRWATGAVNRHPGLLKGARRIRRLVRPTHGRM